MIDEKTAFQLTHLTSTQTTENNREKIRQYRSTADDRQEEDSLSTHPLNTNTNDKGKIVKNQIMSEHITPPLSLLPPPPWHTSWQGRDLWRSGGVHRGSEWPLALPAAPPSSCWGWAGAPRRPPPQSPGTPHTLTHSPSSDNQWSVGLFQGSGMGFGE